MYSTVELREVDRDTLRIDFRVGVPGLPAVIVVFGGEHQVIPVLEPTERVVAPGPGQGRTLVGVVGLGHQPEAVGLGGDDHPGSLPGERRRRTGQCRRRDRRRAGPPPQAGRPTPA